MEVEISEYGRAFAGGILIGLAALLMLLLHGKILGVSGIVGGLFRGGREKKYWRWAFLTGLILGGLIISYFSPETFANTLTRSPYALILAGVLVGFGTRLGGGCTSGHGVCGVSRLSRRSLVATGVFMASGAVTVFVVNHLLGGRL